MKTSSIRTALIDGYLDEPSCLGVPPYISPEIRYTYGSLLDCGLREENIKYYTIDELRGDWEKSIEDLEHYDLVIIVAGTTVPGHYLGGKPISFKEINELGSKLYYPQKVIGGPVTLVKKDFNGFDLVCDEITAINLYEALKDKEVNPSTLNKSIANWAVKGASLTIKHPDYPHLICEIETFRGCPRSRHCAFCSERLKQRTYQRSPEEIIAEVKELAQYGNHFYRLGCQTDLLLYQSTRLNGKLMPNPDAIEELYRGIRKADPDLEVLHLDNINPYNLVQYEKESEQILKTITRYNTPGDIAAFGLESADPLVLEKNNIETDPETTYRAVAMMNEIGGYRENGLPKLLPGINFLHGLIGERKETFDYNYNFLKRLLDQGLMLRRINIRQVVTLGKYPRIKIDRGKFLEYKERVNRNINHPMLKRVFPRGTIMKRVLTEKIRGKITYGRQLGSYPILIGIPGKLKLNRFVDVRVIDHGYRSITALPWPFKIKEATPEQLMTIPGIGKKTASNIFIEKPGNPDHLLKLLPDDFPYQEWKDWFTF
ncbi:radical SAM protein [Halothermothrix orenii]|uniref:Radical SAM domain protein n=1 Tax=Halothermothrix orenii (strain H 168 / OCM 544 / DSM 9562) TaxID=373903 RepID=B8CYV4_HALOH|nr:radical SAM protein [Halothermothrix orenii]ACL70473.1 Radical SAM domain protein [Halothermothrix orenii H 168]